MPLKGNNKSEISDADKAKGVIEFLAKCPASAVPIIPHAGPAENQ